MPHSALHQVQLAVDEFEELAAVPPVSHRHPLGHLLNQAGSQVIETIDYLIKTKVTQCTMYNKDRRPNKFNK